MKTLYASQAHRADTLRKRELGQTMTDKMVKLSYEAMMERFIPPVADEPDAVLFRNIFDPVSDQLEVDIFQRLVSH